MFYGLATDKHYVLSAKSISDEESVFFGKDALVK
jgi:hypothetical protein